MKSLRHTWKMELLFLGFRFLMSALLCDWWYQTLFLLSHSFWVQTPFEWVPTSLVLQTSLPSKNRMKDKFWYYHAALCHCKTALFFFKQPQTTSSGPDSLKKCKKGKILLKIGKQRLVPWDGQSGWSDGGYLMEGLAAVSFLSTACSLHIPFHWQTGTISYSWFSKGCLWKVTTLKFMRDIPKTVSGRWFTIIIVETADSSRKEHLMSNRQLLM